MTTDDEAARKARAERLRKQFEQVGDESLANAEGTEPGASEARPKSPRELIEEKMRELDKNRDHPV